MSLDADLLIDRRRLKRRISLWRALAVVATIGALAAILGVASPPGLAGRAHVARLTVQGFIADDRRIAEALERALGDDTVRGLIVAIDSGGGSVAGGEALHRAIARFAERKPVVAVMGGTAASAAYMAALPANRIFARDSTLTGSIGVLLQSFDASELMERLGVRQQTLASGPLKGQPSPFQPLTDEARAALTQVVADLHGQFVGMVVAGRRMEEARVRELATGRVFTGREAVTLGLVDAIGAEREARAWLAAERAIPAETPVRDLAVGGSAERLLSRTLRSFIKSLISEWLGVDGPLALWQPWR